LPPDVSRVVVGAQLDATSLQPIWKVTLLQFKNPVDLAKLAHSMGGTMDQLNGQPVVLTPRNSFGVSVQPDVVGGMFPANRQEVGRWLRFLKQNSDVVLTPYLQEAATATRDERNHAVMAFDATDVFDLEGIRHLLKESKTLSGEKVDLNALAKLFTGMRGFRFVVRIENDMRGELRLDFSDSVQPLVPYAKSLVLEALGGMGAQIEDLEGWSFEAEDRAIILKGPLTEQGAKKMLSPLFSPAVRMPTPTTAEGTSQPSMDPKLEATLKYYKSMTTLLDELQKQKAKTFNQQAYWYFDCAKKLDELPLLNVDPELLQFGAAVSILLRNLSSINKGVIAQNKYLQMNAAQGPTYVGTYAYGGYGYAGYGGAGYGYTPYYTGDVMINMGYQAAYASGKINAQEGAIRRQSWDNINNGLLALRRKLTEKYQIEF
jgi:hypothetical protein